MGSFPPAAGSSPVSPPRRRVASRRRARFSGRRRHAVRTSKVTVKDDASPGQKRKARAVEDIDDDAEPATSIAPSPPRLTPEEEAELRERRVRDARARAARRVRAVRRRRGGVRRGGRRRGNRHRNRSGWRPRWETPTTKHAIKFRDVSAESVVAVRSATSPDENRAAARFKNQHGGAAKVTRASSPRLVTAERGERRSRGTGSVWSHPRACQTEGDSQAHVRVRNWASEDAPRRWTGRGEGRRSKFG